MKGNDTMTTKRLTKRDHFNALLNIAEVKANPTLVEFIEHELDLLEKKNAADKKPTAQQTANKSICDAILNEMKPNKLYTITEIIKEVSACADLTNQRVSALVRSLIADGKLERVEEKRKAYFRVI